MCPFQLLPVYNLRCHAVLVIQLSHSYALSEVASVLADIYSFWAFEHISFQYLGNATPTLLLGSAVTSGLHSSVWIHVSCGRKRTFPFLYYLVLVCASSCATCTFIFDLSSYSHTLVCSSCIPLWLFVTVELEVKESEVLVYWMVVWEQCNQQVK